MVDILSMEDIRSRNLSVDDNASAYNGLDVLNTFDLFSELTTLRDPVCEKIYTFSKALQAPVIDMMLAGVKIDLARRNEALYYLRKMQFHYQQIINSYADAVWGKPLNAESPQQMKDFFYKTMNIPEVKTRKGREFKVSADKEALEKIANYFYAKPIVTVILALREINGDIEVLERKLSSDGRMRCSFNIAGTISGRFSSSKDIDGSGANLQNISGPLRDIFIADAGQKLGYIDLEQAESRLVGLLSKVVCNDSTYLDACLAGDLHTLVCQMVWPELPWANDAAANKKIAETPYFGHYSYRDLSKRGGHLCLTGDHEVLTPEGWVPISYQPDVIMQWEAHGSRFTSVSSWHSHIETEDLISFDGPSLSAVMTKQHRIPYYNKEGERLQTTTAERGPKGRTPLGDKWRGGVEEVPARLIAAFMADGHQKSVNRMEFHLTKKRKIKRLQSLCEMYGFHFETRCNDKYIVEGNLPKHMGAFMFKWTSTCLEDFVDEYKYWGRHIGPTSVSVASVLREEMEWLQTFGRIIGIGGSIHAQPITQGYVTKNKFCYVLQQNHRRFARAKQIKVSTVSAEGGVAVFCPTVPSSWFYIRRNGKISVTGNSNYGGSPGVMSIALKIPQHVAADFQTKYFSKFPGIKEWHRWVAAELRTKGFLTTPFGRKRCFFSRTDENKTLNEAISFSPQSCIADMLNDGMLRFWRKLQSGLPGKLLIQVHDAVVIQAPEESFDETVAECIACLEAPLAGTDGFCIPCDAQAGWNWGKATSPYVPGRAYKKGEKFHFENHSKLFKTVSAVESGMLLSPTHPACIPTLLWKNPGGMAKWKKGGDGRKRPAPSVFNPPTLAELLAK